jgi:hypothetical protein
MTTPFFTTTLKGGWWQHEECCVTTSRGIDPALSMLLSHVCMTEFSLEKLKAYVAMYNTSQHLSYANDMSGISTETVSATSASNVIVHDGESYHTSSPSPRNLVTPGHARDHRRSSSRGNNGINVVSTNVQQSTLRSR